ncbi:hypothetical protein ACFW91_25125 [Streptomyces asoensis]|uniref:hypothetical protein n=1 Tax=Streptomyces asoensis TaxID=249586 RepID=UPI003691201D
MRARIDTITAVLRSVEPVRPLLAYELRGSLVQLLGPGTTDPTWAAPPQLLAEAIDQALTEEEEKDIPAGTPSTPLPSDGHALIVRRVGGDFLGSCQCGRPLGRTPRNKPLNGLAGLWERHVATTADQAWAEALTSLPALPVTTSTGAS